jgi:hypothetical protein
VNKAEPRKLRSGLQTCETKDGRTTSISIRVAFVRAGVLARFSRFLLPTIFMVPHAFAQAPMLQDGAAALRQARLDWTMGQAPLGPSSMPSLEVGWGGAESDGPYAPLSGGEGIGRGTQGWGLGLQGRYVREGWSIATTFFTLRNQGHTLGILQRAALAYQTESGWRAALELAPFSWGSGLNGGDLLGEEARPFPRLSLSTPEADLPFGRWRAEAFTGRLEINPSIPDWMPDQAARLSAQSAGLGLQHPVLWGGCLRASFGALVETSLGAITMQGGQDAQRQPAPESSARTQSLAELKVRMPSLARWVNARGASLVFSRSAAPDSHSVTLSPGRNLGGLQLVWDRWDLGLEYAAATKTAAPEPFTQPSYLAGFSTHGDPLGSAFAHDTRTSTMDIGLPLFMEGQGRFKAIRAITVMDPSTRTGFWFLQVDAQWRTPVGRIGASLASRRNDLEAPTPRWGWTFSIFQAIRVF